MHHLHIRLHMQNRLELSREQQYIITSFRNHANVYLETKV